VDIGGTYAKVGCLADGVFRMVTTLPTGESCRPGKLLDEICDTVAAHTWEPSAVGLGIAGMVDRPAGGIIRFSPNLPLWINVDAGSILTERLGIPVCIDNDCNVFATGAIHTGLIPSKGLWLFVTLGTGIGGTIINNGIILYGTGFSGEFGHTTVREGGIPCPCGSDGCWERYAGRKALEWYYFSITGRRIPPVEVSRLAIQEEPSALEAFREYGRWIGIGMANLANCFSPRGFFIGGGLSAAFSHFEKAAVNEYSRRCKHSWNVTVLKESPDAGAFGAASMAGLQC
jgi:glucokinase